MKRILLSIACITMGMGIYAQTWVNLGSASASEPQVAMMNTGSQVVRFKVWLSGFYSETKDGGYKRLSIPGCDVTSETGMPELPVLSQMIAIPECAGITCSINVTQRGTLNGYKVYPVPDYRKVILPDGTAHMEEVFSVNAQAYAKSAVPALSQSPEIRTGYLRGQKIAVVDIMPLEYNPAAQTLYVNNEIEVILTFSNPSTPAVANIGIFNNVAANTLVNYSSTGITASVNDRAFEYTDRSAGNVSRIRITDASQADAIQADYLIICSDALYNHPEVIRIARHRAWYNGFDVAILDVEDVISDNVNFYYEGNSDENFDEYKKEQRIRTCIRRIYEGANASHTGDGKLGYVLLVGDTEEGNTGMPTSYDMHLATEDNNIEDGATDFYFSCVTRDENGYDLFGDLYIGRFCVPNDLQDPALYNVVQKTIFSETEFSDMQWKKNVLLGLGDALGGAAIMEPWIEYASSAIQNQQLKPVAYYYYGGGEYYPTSRLFRKDFIAAINSGVGLCDMYCHGGYYHWGTGGMYHDTLIELLDNVDKLPFCVSYSCLTGYFDGKNCFAEKVGNYSAEKGFSAMLAASRTIWQRGPRDGYYGTVLEAIYKNLSHVAGEFILEIKMRTSASASLYDNSHSYLCNLFGDPALNIMADGFEVTKRLSLQEATNISSPVTVKNGGCLIVPENGTLVLNERGSITVESGARLVLENGAKIKALSNRQGIQKITINRGGMVESTNGVIENMAVESSAITLSNIHFKNVEFTQTNNNRINTVIDNCSFTNSTVNLDNTSGKSTFSNVTFNTTDFTAGSVLTATPAVSEFSNSSFYLSPLRMAHQELRIAGCSFDNGSHVTADNAIVKINNNDFTRSQVLATKPLLISFPIGINTPVPSVDISFCNFTDCGAGFDLFNPDPSDASRRSGAISLIRIPEFNISGNTFHNNIYSGGSAWQGEAVYLNGSGTGMQGRHLIADNVITGFETGLLCYSSTAVVNCNRIYENLYGVRLFNNSDTYFEGVAGSLVRWQTINDNYSYEIYATSFPTLFKYNLVYDDTYTSSTGTYLIYYDSRLWSGRVLHFDVANNYWGERTLVPSKAFYPYLNYGYYPVWNILDLDDPPVIWPTAEKLFEAGNASFEAQDYTDARDSYTAVIRNYPGSEYAVASLHKLYALEQYLDNDYAVLRDYYRTADYITADSVLFATADYLATRCDVRMRNWQASIDWYEARIADPPSYPDSIFAVIDLEEIHVEMTGDRVNTKSTPVIACSMPQHVLSSKAEFLRRREELLAKLPKQSRAEQRPDSPGEGGVIHTAYPNPADGVATITYGLEAASQVELRLYNQLGQLLQVIPEGIRPAGTYNAEITLPELPGGIYYCALMVNGQRAATQKLIVK